MILSIYITQLQDDRIGPPDSLKDLRSFNCSEHLATSSNDFSCDCGSMDLCLDGTGAFGLISLSDELCHTGWSSLPHSINLSTFRANVLPPQNQDSRVVPRRARQTLQPNIYFGLHRTCSVRKVRRSSYPHDI